MGFFKKNDSPPCITCSHHVAEKVWDGCFDFDYVHKCELTPDKSGVFYENCSRARLLKFCKYEKKQ